MDAFVQMDDHPVPTTPAHHTLPKRPLPSLLSDSYSMIVNQSFVLIDCKLMPGTGSIPPGPRSPPSSSSDTSRHYQTWPYSTAWLGLSTKVNMFRENAGRTCRILSGFCPSRWWDEKSKKDHFATNIDISTLDVKHEWPLFSTVVKLDVFHSIAIYINLQCTFLYIYRWKNRTNLSKYSYYRNCFIFQNRGFKISRDLTFHCQKIPKFLNI